MIRFFTNAQFHGKQGIGSSRIRAESLIKYWPEAELYKAGEKPDVLIFQKVYVTYNYHFIQHYEGIKILDICDPDWRDTPDYFIKETLDAVDAVVTSSQTLSDYLQRMTDTQCLQVKDRFDMAEFPEPKKHFGEAKTLVWFGYAHNAELIKFAVPSFEARGFKLLMVSNEDPAAWRWANKPDDYQKNYKWVKYVHPEAYKEIQKGDICVFPEGIRPFDKFKSENKTVISELLGIPVIRNSEDLDKMTSGIERNKYIKKVYNKLRDAYDVKKSVEEYKVLIDEIKSKR